MAGSGRAGVADDFDDAFIDRLFELVEVTRNTDEDLNYAVIRLIVSDSSRNPCSTWA